MDTDWNCCGNVWQRANRDGNEVGRIQIVEAECVASAQDEHIDGKATSILHANRAFLNVRNVILQRNIAILIGSEWN